MLFTESRRRDAPGMALAWHVHAWPFYSCNAQPCSECPQNRRQGLHARVALFGERPVQTLAIQAGTRSDLSYASLCLRNVAQRDQEDSRVLLLKRCIEISERPFPVFQHVQQELVIWCTSMHLSSSGNPTGMLWRAGYPFAE